MYLNFIHSNSRNVPKLSSSVAMYAGLWECMNERQRQRYAWVRQESVWDIKCMSERSYWKGTTARDWEIWRARKKKKSVCVCEREREKERESEAYKILHSYSETPFFTVIALNQNLCIAFTVLFTQLQFFFLHTTMYDIFCCHSFMYFAFLLQPAVLNPISFLNPFHFTVYYSICISLFIRVGILSIITSICRKGHNGSCQCETVYLLRVSALFVLIGSQHCNLLPFSGASQAVCVTIKLTPHLRGSPTGHCSFILS